MRIFVTGATGFIGSHFINQAHALNYEVVALRRSLNSIPRVSLNKEPQWLDCLIPEVKAEDLDDFDALVHLAAHSANVPYDTLENCIKANVLEPLSLFSEALKGGIRRFVVAGSCFEYGLAGDRYDFIPANAPMEPTASYPASKAAATAAFHAFACEQNVELIILRIFQVYGEGELETRFWPSLRKAAKNGEDFPMSEGNQIRDFINVENVAASFIEAIKRNDLEAGRPLIENLCTGKPESLLDFAKREWMRLGAHGQLLIGEKPSRTGEINRLVGEVRNLRPD